MVHGLLEAPEVVLRQNPNVVPLPDQLLCPAVLAALTVAPEPALVLRARDGSTLAALAAYRLSPEALGWWAFPASLRMRLFTGPLTQYHTVSFLFSQASTQIKEGVSSLSHERNASQRATIGPTPVEANGPNDPILGLPPLDGCAYRPGGSGPPGTPSGCAS